MGNSHDRFDDVHRSGKFLKKFGFVSGSPNIGISAVGLFNAGPIRKIVFFKKAAHFCATAKFSNKSFIQPRLVDPKLRVHHEPVAVEALNIVSLVGGPITPDVNAIIVHSSNQKCSGDGSAKRGCVEIRLSCSSDMEGPALQSHQTLSN